MDSKFLLKKYLTKLMAKEDLYSLLTFWVIQNPVSFSIIIIILISTITFLIYYYMKNKRDIAKAKDINFEALINHILNIKQINENFIIKAEQFSKNLKNKIDAFMKEGINLDNDVKRSIDMLSNSISMLVKVLTDKEK